MISKKHKAIFIHISKTAGTSIEQKLGHFEHLQRGVQDHKPIAYYEEIAKKARFQSLRDSLYCFRAGQRHQAKIFLNQFVRPEISTKEYETFFKFIFVRNTRSRTYSWYQNIKRDEMHKKRLQIPNDCSFYDFISKHLNPKHFSQLSYITDSKGNIPLDFIGRFENLQEDFDYVCDKIGIQDSSLPELLVSGNNHYTQSYDERTINLVNKLFKEEIDYFNFHYGES